MVKNKPTKQHYVPQCYLREFAHVFIKKEPFIWIFDKNGKNRRKAKVKNVLFSNDLFTLKIQGQKNYSIEETLASLEGKYSSVFRDKVKKKLPLNEEEHIILCAFVAAMLQRTLKHKDNLEDFLNQTIKHMQDVENTHNAEPKESKKWREYKKDAHKLSMMRLIPDFTKILMKMDLAFLCAKKGAKFITSDDPCSLFNPDLQWQKSCGPGLKQKNVQLTLPLSPSILLCMSWSPLKGYIRLDKKRAEDINRMTARGCYKYFISHSPRTKRLWFKSYPMDFFFILKIIKHKIFSFGKKIKYWYELRKR